MRTTLFEPAAHTPSIYGFDSAALTILNQARTSSRRVERRATIASAPFNEASLMLIRSGWAGRICPRPDGARLIVEILLPGDLCGLEQMIGVATSHTVQALTEIEVERFDAKMVISLAVEHPTLAVALLRHSVHKKAMAHANQAGLHKRGAAERIASLVYGLAVRLHAIDGFSPDPETPLTQFDLADATGLTAIHVNRALKDLRIAGVISIDRRSLRVTDLSALRIIAGHSVQQLGSRSSEEEPLLFV